MLDFCVNALSGLYLISTGVTKDEQKVLDECQCPLGLIPHFYEEDGPAAKKAYDSVSMPSRAYTSFLHEVPNAV